MAGELFKQLNNRVKEMKRGGASEAQINAMVNEFKRENGFAVSPTVSQETEPKKETGLFGKIGESYKRELGKVGSVFKGAGKEITQRLATLGSLSSQTSVMKPILEKQYGEKTVEEMRKGPTSPQLESDNFYETVGKVGASYVLDTAILKSANIKLPTGKDFSSKISSLSGPGAWNLIKRKVIELPLEGLKGFLYSAPSGAMEEFASGEDDPTKIKEAAIERGKTGAIFSVAFTSVLDAVGGIANWMKNVGKNLQLSQIKPSGKDLDDIYLEPGKSRDEAVDEFSNYVNKYGLGSTLDKTIQSGTQGLQDRTEQLKNILTEADDKVDINRIYRESMDDIDKYAAQNVGELARIESAKKQLKKELGLFINGEQIRPETIEDGGKIIFQDNLDLIQTNEIKKAVGTSGAWHHGQVDPDARARAIVYDSFYSKLKKAIEEASKTPEVALLNREMSEILIVLRAAIRNIPASVRQKPLSMFDMIATLGAIHNPSTIPVVLAVVMQKVTGVGDKLLEMGNSIKSGSGQIPEEYFPVISSILANELNGRQ